MPTITGLKLSELSTLSLGSTGTYTYVSAANQSFKMPMVALYDTLDRFFISGDYQPKIEDWRFVHRSGNESITGNKTFVGTISVATINNTGISLTNINVEDAILKDQLNTNSVLWQDRKLVNSNHIATVVWESGKLFNSSNVCTTDWQNRILSGNWNANNLQISGKNVVTGDASLNYLSGFIENNFVHNYGNETINGQKTFAGDITFSNNLSIFNGTASLFFNEIVCNGGITFNDITGNYISQGSSRVIDLGSRQLKHDNNTTIDWQNRILSGSTWIASGLNVTNLSGTYIRSPLISGELQRMSVDFNHITLNHKNGLFGLVNAAETGLYYIGNTTGTFGFNVLGANIRFASTSATFPCSFNIKDNLGNIVVSNVTGTQNQSSHTDRWHFNHSNVTGMMLVNPNRAFFVHITSGANASQLATISLFGYYEYLEGFVL